MSLRYSEGGSSTRGSANPTADMSLEDGVPANVVIRAGKNLREAVDPTEEFLLPAGEKRVVMKFDQNDPTTAIFTFNRDGQTLGGLLVSALLALPCVTFAAYRVPHPLFFVFELRLSTDGAMSPKEALLEASKNMVEDLVMLGRRFTHEWELLKQAEMAEGVGRGDSGMAPARTVYTRAVSSAGEAANRGRSFQGREGGQRDIRYQFGAGSPGRPGYQGGGSPVRVGYQGEGQQGARNSPGGVGYRPGGQPTEYQHKTRNPEKLDIPTGGDWGGSSIQDHGMSGYQARGLQENAYHGARNPEAGFQATWASGRQPRSPDRMSRQGDVKAGSPEDPYRASAAVPNRSVNQSFWGNEELEHQTDSQSKGYQSYGSQGLGGGGYQLGPQQASSTQVGGDWTPEYQRANNQDSSHLGREPGSGYHAGGQQTTTIPGGDWTPEYQRLTSQGSGYPNRPQSAYRSYHQPDANDQTRQTQATDPQTTGYQGWDRHHQPGGDTTMDDNDW